MCEEKSGFTLIELLVVICIIVILGAIALPAILKARAQSSVNRTMAEMTSLASTGGTIYLDLKSHGYTTLDKYALPNTTAKPEDITKLDTTINGFSTPSTFSVNFPPGTSSTDFQGCWDGPYATFQPKTTFAPSATPALGNYPSAATGVTGWTFNSTFFPDGTPLDSWGHPYGMGWNNTEQVMVIYSAGPNGKFETNCGDTSTPAGSDDLLYKFR